MTLYAPTDVQSITFPETSGGCGQSHLRGDADRLSISCPGCEAVLAQRKDIYGWGPRPEDASLTPDERAAAEADQVTTDRALSGLLATLSRISGEPPRYQTAPAQSAAAVTPSPAPQSALADLTPEQLNAAAAALDAERTKRTKVTGA